MQFTGYTVLKRGQALLTFGVGLMLLDLNAFKMDSYGVIDNLIFQQTLDVLVDRHFPSISGSPYILWLPTHPKIL